MLSYTAESSKHGVNFAELDSESTNLDLMIPTTEALHISVFEITAEIPALVHPLARLLDKRIGPESIGGEIGFVQITARQTRASNKDFAGYPYRSA